MENNVNIVRCPKCGGMHLTGIYEEQKPGRSVLLFGLLGLISLLFKKRKPSAYWKCLDCGTMFEMKV